MFTLFAIVAIAVLVVASQGEQPRRWGLIVIGGLCLLLGLRAADLLTKSSLTNLVSNVALAQEAAPQDVEPQEAEAQETEPQETTLQAEVTTTEEVGELSAVQPETKQEARESELEQTPIERMTRNEYLDEDSYPDWLVAWLARPTPNSLAFSLASTAGSERLPYVVVNSQLFDTDAEGRRAMDERLEEATGEYINEYLNSSRAAFILGVSADEIRTRLVRDTFQERIVLDGGRLWHLAHAKVVFDDSFQTDLDERWGRIVTGSRLMQTGLGAGVVMMLLATLFGYFRFDTATRGYYTGRLQFATAAAILAVVAAGVLVASCIDWM